LDDDGPVLYSYDDCKPVLLTSIQICISSHVHTIGWILSCYYGICECQTWPRRWETH